MTLLDLLKKRYSQAEKFTKENYIDMAVKAIDDYNAKEPSLDISLTSAGVNVVNRRYEFIIPLIFTNTESMKASLFEKLPELVLRGRGAQDEEKKQKVEAAYEYLKDKLDLETFAMESAHWFILLGFCSAHGGFKSETYDAPTYDQNGQPMVDNNGPIMQTLYKYNDPTIEVGDPLKEFYSPESEFTINSSGCPSIFRKKLISKEEIKRIYNIDIEPDATVEVDAKKSKDKDDSDTKRVNIYYVYTTVPEELAQNEIDPNTNQPIFTNWESGKEYYIIYTQSKWLHVEESQKRNCKLGKWYGNPNSFFGFGTGKIGRSFQIEKSIRRGQQIRLADVAAFPKLAVKNDGKNSVDLNAMSDPRENKVITFKDTPPVYLQPGNLAPIVSQNIETVDQDAQQAFGIMDLSQGAQNATTVKTATGQTIFADAMQRRVQIAKKKFFGFYKQSIIMLLELARDNWDETKLATIMDQQGQPINVEISSADLKDIDFDKDIEFDFESASVNKDIIRQQMISLYDKFKDDPLVDRRPLIKDVARIGFDRKNYADYIKEPTVAPGTVLTDQTGKQFVIDDSGNVVDQQAMNQMGQPSNQQPISNPPQL